MKFECPEKHMKSQSDIRYALLTAFKEQGWQGVLQTWQQHKRERKLERIRHSKIDKVVILTVRNTLYVADLIQNALIQKGIASSVITQKPKGGYDSCLHIVIAAHSFKVLPKMYVAYQLEQYVSGVFSKPKRIKKLQNAIVVMDYSLKNIHYLRRNGFKVNQLFHVPIAQLPQQANNLHRNFEYDVAFYGDTQNDRRQKYLKALGKKFNLYIINNVFGNAALEQLRKAKIVVNIHYYENALLETTRLFECISNGILVVSESASDMEEHTQLNDIVDFVAVDDVAMMVARIEHWLTHEEEYNEWFQKQCKFAFEAPTPFKRSFDNVLKHIGIS